MICSQEFCLSHDLHGVKTSTHLGRSTNQSIDQSLGNQSIDGHPKCQSINHDSWIEDLLIAGHPVNVLNETRAHRVMGRKQAISYLEVDLGVHWNSQAGLRTRDMSLEAATRRLTMYGSEVAWDIHAIEAQIEMVTLITEVQSAINDQDTALDDKSPAMVAFQARSRRIQQALSGLMHWTRYNQQRIQIQLQTVECTPTIH